MRYRWNLVSWAKETSGFDQYRKTCLIICGNTTLSQLKDIEPFMSGAEKNSRFCISCGELATKLVKYDTEGAIIIEKNCDRCTKAIEDSSIN